MLLVIQFYNPEDCFDSFKVQIIMIIKELLFTFITKIQKIIINELIA
jgi:hypothetical protein